MRTKILYQALIILAFASIQVIFSQDIPNGDGDLLWERNINGRSVNDAKFHPINGNIIAAVNHEIWEIDPKDGHTIRIFEGGTGTGEYDQFEGLQITSDGKTIVTDGGSGIEGLLIWDYETGKIKKVFDKGGPNRGSLGIFPDNKRAIFFTFKLEGSTDRQIVIYNFETDKIEKQISIAPYGAEKLSLSKDGKYLAIGKTYNDNGNWTMNMELWDAETLTKIKDFGEASNIVEFTEIKISDNNQYIGFCAEGNLTAFIFDTKNNHKTIYEGGITIQFSNDSQKMFIQQDTAWNNYVTYIIDLTTYKPVYQYKKFAPYNYIFNSNNELFGGKENLLFFSSNWYKVGVKPASKSNTNISPNPATDFITVDLGNYTLKGVVEKDAIEIYNIFGERVMTTPSLLRNDTPPKEGNLMQIDVSGLSPGVYFVKIGNEKPNKFIKL